MSTIIALARRRRHDGPRALKTPSAYDDLPPALLRYLVAVTLAGPLLAALLAVGGPRDVGDRGLLLALVLTGLAVVAERYPLHLTHKTNLNVASAAYVAMVVTLPVALTGALSLLAAATAQALTKRAHPEQRAPELLFNACQASLYVGAGALAFAALDQAPLGPTLGGFGSLGAIVAASLAMHLANTYLVSTAAGLQLGVSPLRIWWQNLALDLTPHVSLTLLGVTAAYVGKDQPLLLLVFVLPGVLVQRAVRQTTRLRVDTHEALASLVEVIELRDPSTAGHSRRVATTARLIAERLGLTGEEADLIESAGRVHDIGKVALDPRILLKPGRLTEEEWRQMKEHPGLGANVVARFAAYQDGARLVRHHHERWDGAGYPDGLAGEAIPLGARILAVADTFDAITSDRPYRAGLDAGAALHLLREGAGSQWDARVVAAFAAVVAERPGDIPLAASRERSTTVAATRAPSPTPAADPREVTERVA